MSIMHPTHHNQNGSLNILLVPFIFAVILLCAALGFGFWAFMGREDYKNNTDQKIAVAVQEAKAQTSAEKDKEFIELEKRPFRTYLGPAAFGGLQVQYPKTWSAYVAVPPAGSGGTPVDGYFHPATVPNLQTQSNTFALRVQVVRQGYDQVVNSYKSLVEANKIKAEPYVLPKLPNIVGVRLTGEVRSKVQGTMIIVPLRSETLKVWTESADFLTDFNNNILPNVTFSP